MAEMNDSNDKKSEISVEEPDTKCAKRCSLKPKLAYNLVLLSILILYGIFGGFVFKTFETTTYENVHQESKGEGLSTFSKREFLEGLWKDRNNNDATTFEQWSKQAGDKLESYVSSRAAEADSESSVVHWRFGDAWLFACTVFTTVGYGNISPLSIKGRVFCMLYGVVGIPLFSVVASSLVAFVTDVIHAVHAEYHRRKRRESADKRKKDDDTSTLSDQPIPELEITLKHVATAVTGYLCVGALFFSLCEGWSLFEAFYYCFITLSTVGLGDYVPQHIHHTIPFGGYILVGLVLVIMLFGALEDVIAKRLNKIKEKLGILE